MEYCVRLINDSVSASLNSTALQIQKISRADDETLSVGICDAVQGEVVGWLF